MACCSGVGCRWVPWTSPTAASRWSERHRPSASAEVGSPAAVIGPAVTGPDEVVRDSETPAYVTLTAAAVAVAAAAVAAVAPVAAVSAAPAVAAAAAAAPAAVTAAAAAAAAAMSTPHLDRSEQWPDGSCNYGTIEDVEARQFQMLPGRWWRRRLFLEKAPRCAVSHQSSWEAMESFERQGCACPWWSLTEAASRRSRCTHTRACGRKFV